MKRGKQIDTWYPFYIDKWLFGSTRHELILKDGDQFVDLRGIWMDLLTISKKDGGWIRANETTPYPTEQLAGMFCVPIEQLRKTIEIALDKGKLTEPTPGFYYISSTDTYKLSDRWKREKAAQFPNEGRVFRKRGSIEDIKREDRIGEDRIGNRPVHTQTKSQHKQPNIQLILDEEPKRWEGITAELKALWAKTYPGCNIETVLQEMIAYWDAQPKSKRKLNWKITIVNRLKWLQDHGGTSGYARRGAPPGTWLKMMKEKEEKK